MKRSSFPLSVERLEEREVPAQAVLLGTNDTLYRIDTNNPGVLGPAIAVTGLPSGYHLDSIDFITHDRRPGLYGLLRNGSTGKIARIDAVTGQATIVSTFSDVALPQSAGVAGGNVHYDLDFIPGSSVFHAIGSQGQGDNFTVNTRGYTTSVGTKLEAGHSVRAVAYNRNFDGNSLRTLYGIDPVADQLVTIGSFDGNPNGTATGKIDVVGGLGVNFEATANVGFDINNDSVKTGILVAADQATGKSRLYSIDLDFGNVTALGVVGTGSIDFKGLALVPERLLAVGVGPGGGPHVKVFDAATGELVHSFFAFDAGFKGGVRVATGDVNRDGAEDVVVAGGPGGPSRVRAFDGQTGGSIRDFLPYGPNYKGGVYVASADVDDDGRADIVTGTGAGAAPHVKVFDGGPLLEVLHSFMAYNATFKGGVRVAAGQFDSDSKAEIITGTGPGGGPHVKVFSGENLSILHSFLAYKATASGGLYVAAGDLNHDGFSDIITGLGEGTAPHIKAFDGDDGTPIASFLADAAAQKQGWRVASTDADGDGDFDIVVGYGPGGSSTLKAFDLNGTLLESSSPFGASGAGVFVG